MKNSTLIFALIFSSLLYSCDKDPEIVKPPIQDIILTEDYVSVDEIDIKWTPIEGGLFYDLTISNGTQTDTYRIEDETHFSFEDLSSSTEYLIKIQATSTNTTKDIIGQGSLTVVTQPLPKEFMGIWRPENDKDDHSYTFLANGTGFYKAPNGNVIAIQWTAYFGVITITKLFPDSTSESSTMYYTFFSTDGMVMGLVVYRSASYFDSASE